MSIHRSGLTLLEVLLTLALAVVLIGLVGGTLRFYSFEMNVRDTDVRQTHLAAAVMQMIEDDLRSTLHLEPIDTSGLAALLSATAGNAAGGLPTEGAESEEDLSAAGIDSADATDATEEDLVETETPDLLSGAAILQTPGLIGNQYQIQIDVSRLPRLEEYVMLLDSNPAKLTDIPSDIKTVSYFVQGADTVGGVEDPLDTLGTAEEETSTPRGGLVRRSLDRAASTFAVTGGTMAMLNQTGEILAPEILGIEFEYWDGTQWLIEWSSDQYEELPLAVKVTLSMATPQVAAAGNVADVTDPNSIRTFVHVVRLPMARMIEEEEEEEDLEGAGI